MTRRLLLLTFAALASCTTPKPPDPAVLELQLSAGADQNPDTVGRPAPVAVHLFQLSSTTTFERADVFALIERERATLGPGLLASEEFVLKPGERRTITRNLAPGARFLGAAVLYRDINHASWRALAAVAPTGTSRLTLTTTGITTALEPAPGP